MVGLGFKESLKAAYEGLWFIGSLEIGIPL